MRSGGRGGWIIFVSVLILGIVFTSAGLYLFFQSNGISILQPYQKLPTYSGAAFFYLPMPTAQENNPLSMNAVLLPFVNGSHSSVLNLTIAATFGRPQLNVSFLFESTFNIIPTYNSTGSGNGDGRWYIWPWHTNTGQPDTRIQFLFKGTDRSLNYTSFTESKISLNITGLPYMSNHGRFVVIFPFNSQEMVGTAVREGSFTVCPATGYILTYANQPSHQIPNVCPGSPLQYQFGIDQSQQLTMIFENLNAEREYSYDQALSLLFLGIGVPLVVSSIPLFPSQKENIDYDRLAGAIAKRNHRNVRSKRRNLNPR